MMTILTRSARRAARRARGASRWLTAATLMLPVLACGTLKDALDVTAPDKIESDKLNDPAFASLLVNSAQGKFECSYNAFVLISGLNSGELVESSQTTARYSYDRRDVGPGEGTYASNNCDVQQSIGIYTPVSQARFLADQALSRLQGWTDAQVDKRQELMARAAIYAGYSRIILGELFCTAAIDQGPELTPDQIFAGAEDRFTTAIAAAQAANNAQLVAFAYAGRARARLDRGNKAGASADAKLVPAGFVAATTSDASSNQKINRLFDQFSSGFASVSPTYLNLTVPNSAGVQVPDTRVALTQLATTGNDRTTKMITANKYASGGAPIPIASYTEAQLIIAEADGGQTAVGIINALRTAAGLPGAFQSTDATAIQNEVIKERSRALFLQGNRMFDIRRLSLPQIPVAGTAYRGGGVYGSQTCLPLPDVERLSNPTLKPKS